MSLTDFDKSSGVQGAVVFVKGFNGKRKKLSQGIGLILINERLLVLNYNLFLSCISFDIVFRDGDIPCYKILGFDKNNDILLLRLNNRINKFQQIQFANLHTLREDDEIKVFFNLEGQRIQRSGNITSINFKNGFIEIIVDERANINSGAVFDIHYDLIGIIKSSNNKGNKLRVITNDKIKSAIESLNGLESVLTVPSRLILMGDEAFNLYNYELALYFYNEYLKLQPDNFQILFKIADTYFRIEEYELALENCEKAILINPDNEFAKGLESMIIHARDINILHMELHPIDKDKESNHQEKLKSPISEELYDSVRDNSSLMPEKRIKINSDESNTQDEEASIPDKRILCYKKEQELMDIFLNINGDCINHYPPTDLAILLNKHFKYQDELIKDNSPQTEYEKDSKIKWREDQRLLCFFLVRLVIKNYIFLVPGNESEKELLKQLEKLRSPLSKFVGEHFYNEISQKPFGEHDIYNEITYVIENFIKKVNGQPEKVHPKEYKVNFF